MQLRGAWDWNNPRRLGEQPGERDLSRCRLLPFCDAAEQINQSLIGFEGLRREARESAAKVGAVELRVFVDFSGKEAFAKRTVWNEADSQFLKRRYHFLLRSSGPQGVFALKRSERLHGVCSTDRLHACFGKTEVLDLALLNQFLHRTRDVFDLDGRVNAVLIEQIDNIGSESFERALDRLLDVLRSAVQTRRSRSRITATQVESEFCGDHHLLAKRCESFTHEFFVDRKSTRLNSSHSQISYA